MTYKCGKVSFEIDGFILVVERLKNFGHKLKRCVFNKIYFVKTIRDKYKILFIKLNFSVNNRNFKGNEREKFAKNGYLAIKVFDIFRFIFCHTEISPHVRTHLHMPQTEYAYKKKI